MEINDIKKKYEVKRKMTTQHLTNGEKNILEEPKTGELGLSKAKMFKEEEFITKRR